MARFMHITRDGANLNLIQICKADGSRWDTASTRADGWYIAEKHCWKGPYKSKQLAIKTAMHTNNLRMLRERTRDRLRNGTLQTFLQTSL